MKSRVYILLVLFVLGMLSSCRPSYMKCPKNRRCIVKNTLKETHQKDFIIKSLSPITLKES